MDVTTRRRPHGRRGCRGCRAAIVTVAAVLGLIGGGTIAVAGTGAGPGDWPTLSELGLAQPESEWLEDSVVRYETTESVRPVETVEQDAGETVISLSSDILFTPDSWELPASAGEKITDLLADVPQGSELAVHGHTDSVQGAVDNQELSEKRAAAVADLVKEARGDLTLDVQGFANTRPKKPESGPDDLEARQANRRVELRYG